LSGLPAPVMQSAIPDDYTRHAEQVQAAFLEVSRQMGHERPSITGAYVSSVPLMGRLERICLQRRLESMAMHLAAIRGSGVLRAWLVGRSAQGLALTDGTALQVAIRLDNGEGEIGARVSALGESLSARAMQRVAVLLWMGEGAPGECAEIQLACSDI